ncbi:WXG100 family type VII secretion target [Gleimia hominis]|uniref:ESAT-6-like protein n=1 Tax=Gleimia hominis TaxID=595468 RepID=A0ABU3ICF2_9ACTO|nr:WXG100 family type VII secretion target [Gleimia hominis]MDT3768045.1 WXG100 family type VII secretion target [Gleimia hominis]WIK63841.1 WXG100 family type VII secretion target [Gleimia hominis]
MAVFQVDSEEVARCSALVRSSVESVRSQVHALMGNLQALEASWQGAASNQFSSVVANWRATQAQVEASLDQIGSQMSVAAATYSDAEAQSLSLFAG